MEKVVIHLIPYNGIGGVETAAQTMANVVGDQMNFQVMSIYPAVSQNIQRLITFLPLYLLTTTYHLAVKKPDLLIVSLWRSCIVGLLAKCFQPKLKIVLFLHLPNDVHIFDRWLTHMMRRFAHQVWADSRETLSKRFPDMSPGEGKVISFVTHRHSPLDLGPVQPVFMFWGRIHPQKGFERALNIFSGVREILPNARFTIIGPDGGDLERIEKLAGNLGIVESVCFLGRLSFDEIALHAKSASFYLQTSRVEGMAMSVVEAMQLGLVPIVTPVGEIRNYCRHGHNAIIVSSDEIAIREVCEVIQNNTRFKEMSRKAIETWSGQPLYADSVLDACRSILRD